MLEETALMAGNPEAALRWLDSVTNSSSSLRSVPGVRWVWLAEYAEARALPYAPERFLPYEQARQWAEFAITIYRELAAMNPKDDEYPQWLDEKASFWIPAGLIYIYFGEMPDRVRVMSRVARWFEDNTGITFEAAEEQALLWHTNPDARSWSMKTLLRRLDSLDSLINQDKFVLTPQIDEWLSIRKLFQKS